MRRLALIAVVGIVAMSGRAWGAEAAPAGGIEGIRGKTALGAEDRAGLRQWLVQTATAMVTNTDPDRKGMIVARDAILAEGRREDNQNFRQVFGEEAIAALKDVQSKAISPESRVNLFMVVAELKRLEGVPLLEAALEKDPYAASRYWGARGMAEVADQVVEKNQPRLEVEMSDAAAKAFDTDLPSATALALFEMLGKFDHERARDVLADGVSKYVQKAPASDPVVSQILVGAIAALEKAYAKDQRPEGKSRILSAYATLCAWVMPPTADPSMMFNLNASLEKITGDKVGFSGADDEMKQKLALVEWVEKLVRSKKIAKRPPVPAVVEDAAKEAAGAAAGAATK